MLRKPDHILFTWDSRKNLRRERYPLYKNRNKDRTAEEIEEWRIAYAQYTLLRRKILPMIGFNNQFWQKGYEADDIMSKFVQEHSDEYQMTLVTSDEDMYQTLNHCRIYKLTTNKFYSYKDLFTEYQINPNKWKDVKAIAGCFDKQTEMLTDRGWVFFPDIQKSDQAYSMDTVTKIANYEKITNLIKYKYSGEMYQINGQLIDCLITPNHEFFGDTTQRYPTKKTRIKFKEIQDIVKYKNFTIPITSTWNGKSIDYFILPEFTTTYLSKNQTTVMKKVKPALFINIKDWLAFLGIWLADGHISNNRNGNIGTISISKEKEIPTKKMQKILDKTPFTWWRYDHGWKTDNVQLANYLKQFRQATIKYIPQKFKDLSTDLLQILIDSMMLGDGCISTFTTVTFGKRVEYTRSNYYTSSKQLADDFQEIVIKCGFSASVTNRKPRKWNIKGKSGWSKKSYSVSINKSKNLNLLNKQISKIQFNDYVYDVTTEPYHTIFIRRNGKAYWSSNCKSDHVPGVNGVAEKTAAKYLRGELNKTTKAYANIEAFKKTEAYNVRNKWLVSLPLEGTKLFEIQQDHFNIQAFVEICEQYHITSFREHRLKEWSSLFRR